MIKQGIVSVVLLGVSGCSYVTRDEVRTALQERDRVLVELAKGYKTLAEELKKQDEKPAPKKS